MLRETRTTPRLVSGMEAAAAILCARFGTDEPSVCVASGLLDFQRDAVVRARSILARRGGVLIADSVGLGKTHVALELLRPAFDARAHITIVGPATLERHWRSAARDRGEFEWASYARLGRGSVPPGQRDFVVFDEAHALRNPGTHRHRAAHTLARGASVVLLSATPVNNSLWDLYHLLRLFAGDRAFADVGVPSLRAAFEDACTTCLLGSTAAIQPVLRAVLVRRTRSVLGQGIDRDAGVAGLSFPRQEDPVPIYYAMGRAGEPGLLEPVGAALLELDFPVHRYAGTAPVELLRRSLLKRLESSVHAFARSVGSYDALLRSCARAAENGMLVRPRDRVSIDDEQLGFDSLLYEPIPSGDATRVLRGAIDRELERVARMLGALAGAPDTKLAALERLLDGSLRGRRVIVFTQFRDTARYLHDRLSRRFRCALIDGAGAMLGKAVAERASVVRRFAPMANEARPPAAAETIDVLVATDVLSEGFNLQDASAVVSYDLPWNPIRLVQRIGRVDRLGSPHASVSSFHFLPGDLDRYLGLVERLAAKTSAIEASIGSDVPALHADIVRALDRRDAGELARLESEHGAFAFDERLRALARRLPPP
ncbi:MAG TPA: helicase-related protein, partial [Thermoanaerobaculia bacterium]